MFTPRKGFLSQIIDVLILSGVGGYSNTETVSITIRNIQSSIEFYSDHLLLKYLSAVSVPQESLRLVLRDE